MRTIFYSREGYLYFFVFSNFLLKCSSGDCVIRKIKWGDFWLVWSGGKHIVAPKILTTMKRRGDALLVIIGR